MQHDPLDQIPQRHVQVLGEGLHHLEHARLDANSGLRAFDRYHGNNVTWIDIDHPLTERAAEDYDSKREQ